MEKTVLDIASLSPSRHAALTKLLRHGEIQWSGTDTQEAKALNWLVKNGYATKINGCYKNVRRIKS